MLSIVMAPLRWSRNLYDWVLKWGESRHSQTALFFLSFAEASFFPIPPDALLIALCMGAHKKWMRFAAVCSVGSVLGGLAGYFIGYGAFELVGEKMLEVTAAISGADPQEMLETARYWFNDKELYGMKVGVWSVAIAGFTPIPYKVFTIAAGFFEMALLPFLIASALSRSLRFFVVAGIIGILYEKHGKRISDWIDRYFNWLAIGFVVLLVLGFFAIGSIKGD